MTETRTELPAALPSAAEPYRLRWLVLAVVLGAEIMDLLDTTIVNVALPAIRADLGGGTAGMQWIAAGYTLAMAILLITGGRLGDLFGRSRVFVVGAAGFTAASALCVLSISPAMLIGSRVLEGAFGAVMIPQGLGIIRQIFPADEQAKAFGAFGPVMGLAAVAGPIVAGGLIAADLFGSSWRGIFLINLPIGLATLLGAIAVIPDLPPTRRSRLDLTGLALVAAASVLLIYPLVQGRDLGWPVWTFLAMGAAVPLLAIFAQHQRHRAGRRPTLIETSLFGKRAYTGGLLVALAFFTGMTGMLLVFSLYLQLGLRYSALRAGLALLPWSLGIAIGAGLAGAALAPRFGRRVLHAGLLVMVAGLAALIATVQAGGGTVWQFTPSTLVMGIGMGLVLAPLFDIVLAGVDQPELGSASGVLAAIQQLGSALGAAALGTAFLGLAGPDHVGRAHFGHAMTVAALIGIGALLASFGLAFLLPRHARAEPDGGGEPAIPGPAAAR